MHTSSPSGPLAALGPLLSEPLVVVDVGARWGVARVWDELGDGCATIGFEPDEEECRRLATLYRGRPQMRFVPLALGQRPGPATIFLTRDRACSSVYPPSTAAISRHPGLEIMRPEATATVEMTTLDAWCAAEGVAQVDVVKVDTQGSELAVLQGATATLGTVRAVEVEVEFNALYDGVPLFAHVDEFLRRHGFELWKLRDLAHYGSAAHAGPHRTMESCYYDDLTATFHGGPGQLFWANAFYLKPDVAHPDAGTGWERLVRDACITGALGFPDLHAAALELARASAPEAVRARIVAGPAGAPVAPPEPAPSPDLLSGTMKVSFDDAGFVGGGWGPPTAQDAGFARWSGPGRDSWVDVPVAIPAGTRFELLATTAMSPEILEGLQVELNRVPLGLARSPHEHGVLYSGIVPDAYASTRAFTRVMVHTPPAIPLHQGAPGPGDEAELGVMVAWLRLTPPASAR